MEKIRFSIIVPAIRKHLYRKFYNSINYKNNTSFEIIFAGFSPPKEEFPSNFKYINTKVSAIQCWEIAARESKGEYLILATDDCLFSPSFLDRMDYYINRAFMEKSLIGTRYQTNGVFYDKILTYERKISNSPVLPSTCAFKRDVWMELGGLDKRFTGAFCNADMVLRFYEYGYHPFITPDCWLNEIREDPAKDQKTGWWSKTGKQGRKLCNSFWVKDKIFMKNRLEPVIPFVDKDILTINQGI